MNNVTNLLQYFAARYQSRWGKRTQGKNNNVTNLLQYFAARYQSRWGKRTQGKNNNGRGTFYKSRSRLYWNTANSGTMNLGRNEAKRVKRQPHGVHK